MMTEIDKIVLAITTVPDQALAVKVSETLVDKRLAACVHRLPVGVSTYRWQGRVETAEEITLLIKTRAAHLPSIETTLLALHPYQTPELLAFVADQGLATYMDWVQDET